MAEIIRGGQNPPRTEDYEDMDQYLDFGDHDMPDEQPDEEPAHHESCEVYV